ncbi:hypothetical protein CDAR_170481 [Caerostris darwini]|uniref:Uncharacterized protein n=1 Tax=Caerostris darwini TaxID=1538125 RepID=A0AAV4R718_9ARAC|nr:hypothetical protein CDAR_170481 [Caerostris darwini]
MAANGIAFPFQAILYPEQTFQRTPASPLKVADRSSSKSPPLIKSSPFQNWTREGRKVEVIFVVKMLQLIPTGFWIEMVLKKSLLK